MKGIDLLVAVPNLQRFRQVAMIIAIDDTAKLTENALCHRPQRNCNLICPLLIAELFRAFCYVRGEIAYALEICGDTQGADNFTQVNGKRLAPRDRPDGFYFDVLLKRIDHRICGLYRASEFYVAFLEGVERIDDLLLRPDAHVDDRVREFSQIRIKSCCGVLRHVHS